MQHEALVHCNDFLLPRLQTHFVSLNLGCEVWKGEDANMVVARVQMGGGMGQVHGCTLGCVGIGRGLLDGLKNTL